MEFGDNELIEHKELADRIVASLLPAEEKLRKICLKYASGVSMIEKKLQESVDYNHIAVYSKQSEDLRKDFLAYLTLHDKVKKLIYRNSERSKYLNKVLSDSGIYKHEFDKKRLSEIEKENLENISVEAVGLNGNANGQLVYFSGVLFKQINGVLDFSDPFNKELLKTSSDEILHKIVSQFPESVATIDASSLVNTKTKVMVLKEITSYVYDQAKFKSFYEINKSLGNLLSFSKEIPENLETYIVGVQNMFNVMVKNYLKENYSTRKDDIDKMLKCNENSLLIPEERLKKKEDELNITNTREILYAKDEDINYDEEVIVELSDNDEDVTLSPEEQDTLELLELLGIEINESDIESNE